jgi:hypothetical protein
VPMPNTGRDHAGVISFIWLSVVLLGFVGIVALVAYVTFPSEQGTEDVNCPLHDGQPCEEPE